MKTFIRAVLGAIAVMTTPVHAQSTDPYLWLEDVDGEKAMQFVRAENQRTLDALSGTQRFQAIQTEVRAVLDSRERIPAVVERGPWLYNLWQDAANPRGLWRRTTWEEFRKPTPAWEIVLDIDALAKSENENWVWAGTTCLPPQYQRCLIEFSRGGGDATVVREFDTTKKSFVSDGFTLPEAKSSVTWRDIDTIYVGTDFGPGSMTTSGYPRLVKRWQRGTPLAAASQVYAGESTDVSVNAWVDPTPGHFREGVYRGIEFFKGSM
ncbi:MAG: S9 family peptidase, partial [Burkholderiaceae bacterium]